MIRALVILFSINIVTSQPAFEEFYFRGVDYDGYIYINDILSISDANDDELSYNFMYDYNNDKSINVNDIHSIIATTFGLGLWNVYNLFL